MAWGGGIWLLSALLGVSSSVPLGPFLLGTVAAASLGGLTLSAYYWYGKRRYRLPAWTDLSPR